MYKRGFSRLRAPSCSEVRPPLSSDQRPPSASALALQHRRHRTRIAELPNIAADVPPSTRHVAIGPSHKTALHHRLTCGVPPRRATIPFRVPARPRDLRLSVYLRVSARDGGRDRRRRASGRPAAVVTRSPRLVSRVPTPGPPGPGDVGFPIRFGGVSYTIRILLYLDVSCGVS